MRTNSQLPPSAGVGFKPQHFSSIIAARQPIGFFEIHAENYMGAGGPPHAMLRRLREDYALSIHGVGLSIGGTDALDREHIGRLKQLCDRYLPESFSEHLAWSSHGEVYFNDLLPLPYTEETLASVISHVDQVQDGLQRQMLLENPSTYVQFSESDIPEAEFLSEIARRTGCGLLLDINNVFVQATNHARNADDYLRDFPLGLVREIHLGGHDRQHDGMGAPLLIDSHGSAVADPVWTLFDRVIERTGPLSTLIEWDNDVPDWTVLVEEACSADRVLTQAAQRQAA